jgi:tetratricopeptide (TPR) repeat protein
VAIDREETLRKAEKLLRQGRLDAAIAEYARVAETHPGDLATVNKLGELYQRAGRTADAITCFGRVADHWLLEGLHAKATSHYKKILKLNPNDEAAMLQIVESTAQQGLLPEAKTYLRAALDRRLARGDERGADELMLRLADLDPNDFEAWLAGLRIRVRDNPEADLAPVLRDAIAKLDGKGRSDEADALTLSVIELDPDDVPARVRASRAAMRRGDYANARDLLQDPASSESYDVALIAAELALAEGEDTASRRTWFERLLVLDRVRAASDLVAFGDRLVAEDVDASYACVEVLADHHAVAAEFREATDLVSRFLTVAPKHLPALLRLVELCVDGDFDAELTDAQGRLADVYLEVGQYLQARVIGEDLLSRDPRSTVQRDRLHRALVALGESDPDAAITELLGFAEEALHDDLPVAAPSPPLTPPVEEPDFAGGTTIPVASFGVDSPVDDVIESPWVDDSPAFQAADLGGLAAEPDLPVSVVPAPVAAAEPAVQPSAIERPAIEAPAIELREIESQAVEPQAVEPQTVEPQAVERPAVETRAVEPEPVDTEAAESEAVVAASPPKGKGARGKARKAAKTSSPTPKSAPPPVVEPVEEIDLSREIDLTAALDALSLEDDDEGAQEESADGPESDAEAGTETRAETDDTAVSVSAAAAAVSAAAAAKAAASAASAAAAAAEALLSAPTPEWGRHVQGQGGHDSGGGSGAPVFDAAANLNFGSGATDGIYDGIDDGIDEGIEEGAEEGAGGDEDDLESVFEGLREQAADSLAELPQTDQSLRLLGMADTYQAAGMIDEARGALEQAAADPRYRFKAALALGRLFWREGRAGDAIGWLEQASEAPAPTPDDGHAVLYELAEKLEETGENTRALAVLLDLVAEQEDYRDARARIDRLVRLQAAQP